MDVQPLAISIGLPGQRKTRPIPRSASRAAPADPGGGGAATIASRRPWLFAYTRDLDRRGAHRARLDDAAHPDQPDDRSGHEWLGPGGTVGRDAALDRVRDDRVAADPSGSRRSRRVDVPLPVRGRRDGPRWSDGGRLGRIRLDHRAARARSVPWYGTLANHAVMALAAVIGGLTSRPSRALQTPR